MKEKILKKLQEQRGQNSQVSDKTLETMATTFALTIADDEALAKVDFKATIESLQGNISTTVKTEIEKQKPAGKTAEQIEAERLAKEKADAEKAKADKEKGISPEVAELIEQNKQIMATLANINGEKITNTRTDTLNKALENAPDVMKNTILNGFKNMNFQDDEAFNSYVETTKNDVTAFQQTMSEKGVTFDVPAQGADTKQDDEGVDPVFAEAFKAKEEQEKVNN